VSILSGDSQSASFINGGGALGRSQGEQLLQIIDLIVNGRGKKKIKVSR
jgi:hypothetical protein